MRYFFLVSARTSEGMYPELPLTPPVAQPSAPPLDQGYGGSSGLSSSSDSDSRGLIRPHSESPFERNVRMRGVTVKEEEEVNLEAISCLLNFTIRDIATQTSQPTASGTSQDPMVRTFRASTPNTPAAAPRRDRPTIIRPGGSFRHTSLDPGL